jgi:ATP-dependent helicase HrpA
VIGTQLQQVRSRSAFDAWVARVRRELGPAVQALTERVDTILKVVKGLRSALQPPLMGYATANLIDARAHLDSLVHPGFLHDVGFERLAHYPRYLEGLRLRLERLKRDPVRDQAKLLEVQPFWQAWQRLRSARPNDPQIDGLRWLIEEFRVSQFAQELKTPEPVSAKRLSKLVESL